jgi:hypothetical protein
VTEQDHLSAIALPLLRYLSGGYPPSVVEIAHAVREAANAMSRTQPPSRVVQVAVAVILVDMTASWKGEP